MLARWSQTEDDLFDWHEDLRHGKTSHFLTEAARQKEFPSVQEWVIREGFQQGLQRLELELSTLFRLAGILRSPNVIQYLNRRKAILENQKLAIGAAFQTLQEVAKIIEPVAT